MSSITQQIHDDRALLDCLIELKEIRSWHPSILLCLFPARTVLAHTNNDVEALVPQAEALTVSLRAVADEGECVILEVVLSFYQSPDFLAPKTSIV